MKRSEVLLNLQRFYTQKHVMVEVQYITKDKFMDQVLQLVEEMGMMPPRWLDPSPGQSERTFSRDGDWHRLDDLPDGTKQYALETDGWEPE